MGRRARKRPRNSTAITVEQSRAYAAFSAAIATAKRDAGEMSLHTGLPPEEVVDFSEAIAILRDHPQLTKYLAAATQRDAARSTAMTARQPSDWAPYAVPGQPAPDFLTRSRP